MPGERASTGRGTRARYTALLAAVMALPVCAAGENRAPGCEENTPLSRASPECIRALMKESESRPAVAAAAPESALEARTRALESLVPAAAKALLTPEPPSYAGIQIYTAALVSLKPEAHRGTITYPLYRGALGGAGGRRVYFVLAEASDARFAAEFGVTHAIRLASVNQEGTERGTVLSEVGTWLFPRDPGRLVHLGGDGETRPLEEDEDYSPLKRIRWQGREIIVNMPFVKWGDEPGQQLMIDKGGCDPLIRRSPPNRFRVGRDPGVGLGPSGCERPPDQAPLDRYRGGQVLDLHILEDEECPGAPPWKPCGWVTMKLHQTVHRPDVYPYLTIFSASDAAAAEELGIPYTPKLAHAGRSIASPPLGLSGPPGQNQGVSSLVEFANGLAMPDGGPMGFQPGTVNYGEPTWSNYSPIVQVTWAFFDCGGTGEFAVKERNESFGAVPAAGVAGFDPGRPSNFNPFAMAYQQVACPNRVIELAENPAGIVYRDRLFDLARRGSVMITEWPPGRMLTAKGADGSRRDHPSGMHLLLDAPAPVAFVRP